LTDKIYGCYNLSSMFAKNGYVHNCCALIAHPKSQIKYIMNEHLSKSGESFCENIGLFGVLLSAACLGQNFVFMTGNWFSIALIGVYSLSLVAYVLLMKKSHRSTLLLCASAVLVLTIELIIVKAVFSLVLVMLLCYLSVTLFLMYGSNIITQLKQKYLDEKNEQNNWVGKI